MPENRRIPEVLMRLQPSRIHIVTNQRRPSVPGHWIIMNAPVPLYGHKFDLGPGPNGNYTVAINPAEGNSTFMIQDARENGAWTLLYLTPKLLRGIGAAHWAAKAGRHELHQLNQLLDAAANTTPSEPTASIVRRIQDMLEAALNQ